jgi:ubiquinol oxidase
MLNFIRSNAPAPQIAIDYWRLQPDAKLLDVIYAVRSDETTHRFVNHSLANLNVNTDVNPFALREPDMHVKGKKIQYALLFPLTKSVLNLDRFDRDEAEKYVQESHQLLQQKKAEQPPAR